MPTIVDGYIFKCGKANLTPVSKKIVAGTRQTSSNASPSSIK